MEQIFEKEGSFFVVVDILTFWNAERAERERRRPLLEKIMLRIVTGREGRASETLERAYGSVWMPRKSQPRKFYRRCEREEREKWIAGMKRGWDCENRAGERELLHNQPESQTASTFFLMTKLRDSP